MESFERPRLPSEQELETLFRTDQRDRSDNLLESNPALIQANDNKRLERARELYVEYRKDPRQFSCEALYYLAFLFHHGAATEDYERAFELAQESASLGSEAQ